MNTIQKFIENKNSFRHHALLLLSNYFSQNSLPENEFKLIVQEFCGIILTSNKDSSCFEIAAQHTDIFIADRERKILRLEDIKAIREFSLYPPQQAKKRLFLIENCERLNANAANSLLKVLEEPSTACLFVFTSSKLSLVLPTIASRVQKIAVSFPDAELSNNLANFLPEDIQWIKNQIEQFNIKNYLTKNSLNNAQIAQILTKCEKLAKEYGAEELREVLVSLINKKLKQDFNFNNTAKLFLANVAEWKNYEGYNPSTTLWLTRLFLLFA